MNDVDAVLRENLSPKALRVLDAVREIQAVGAEVTKAIDSVEAEALTAEGGVCACADGQGFLTDLVIADWVVGDYTVEELEDAISDAMADASGRGQAAGERLLSGIDERLGDAGEFD